MTNKKVWLVTGCSKGLGNALVKKLLDNGYYVAASSRDKQSLIQQFGNESDHFMPVSMDITDENNVKAVVEQISTKFEKLMCL